MHQKAGYWCPSLLTSSPYLSMFSSRKGRPGDETIAASGMFGMLQAQLQAHAYSCIFHNRVTCLAHCTRECTRYTCNNDVKSVTACSRHFVICYGVYSNAVMDVHATQTLLEHAIYTYIGIERSSTRHHLLKTLTFANKDSAYSL